ncbi:unnamed protein product [Fusarium fujikuroi]|uniref:Uncharacterized protein n=1 Tax=Fusarium fujikuroi TaxID=5127 RepID=A0A9Q9UEI0_FUSFU|nr:uncharacterized protein FFE2_04882 [Fusarium fujikuroi]SCV35358.1 uncharacterized protein FFFS_04698 [Fusarium fujikuroi]VTT63498.1 unnamed protein product [Fusarium fujikuroi]VTT73805.1 unnamed protein product [Fusarium fujikuroi]VZI04243.1 unnamed protein product [Fusarium fujikuroi]
MPSIAVGEESGVKAQPGYTRALIGMPSELPDTALQLRCAKEIIYLDSEVRTSRVGDSGTRPLRRARADGKSTDDINYHKVDSSIEAPTLPTGSS